MSRSRRENRSNFFFDKHLFGEYLSDENIVDYSSTILGGNKRRKGENNSDNIVVNDLDCCDVMNSNYDEDKNLISNEKSDELYFDDPYLFDETNYTDEIQKYDDEEINLDSVNDEYLDEENIMHDEFSKTFNILEECHKLIRNHFNKSFPDDADSIIDINSNTTKQEFCEKYLDFAAKHGYSESSLNDMMCLLSTTFPKINFPIQKSKSGNVVCSAKKYVALNQVNPILSYHACSTCNEEVFAGPMKEQLLKCSLCSSNRFTKCSNPMCKTKRYEDCTHSMNYRVPKLVVYYKPFIPLLIKLVSSQEFLDAFKFKYIKPSSAPEYEFMDVLDGKVAKEHLQQMDNANIPLRFNYFIFVNLLLGLFYDGIQLYKVFKNCWPIFIHILNLPPTFRSRLGSGMFLSSLFGGEHVGSLAETFAHEECFINELKELYNGIQFQVSSGEVIFLRAHLIQLLFYTKAYEKMLKTEAVGAKSGCFLCNNSQIGTRRNLLNKTVYADIRKFLPFLHFLDTMGNSTQPHPEIFYTNTEDEIFDYIEDNKLSAECKYIILSSKVKCETPRQVNIKTLNQEKYKDFISEFKNDKKPYVWFHDRVDGRFDFEHFKDSLHFANCHLNAKVAMRLITQEEFTNRGTYANLTGKACRGIKGNIALSELSGFDLCKNFCFDPFHCLGGVCLAYFQILKGKQ